MMKYQSISDGEGGDEVEVKRQHVIVGLQLLEKEMDQRCVSIRCTFHVPELNVRYFNTMVFDKEHCDGEWGTDRVDMGNMPDVQHCTIRLKMEIVDVFDDGKCVTQIVEESGNILASK